jgi:hypothetical protein
MKKTISATLLMLACTTLAMTGSASAQAARFAGHWKNVDAHTRGLVELEIKVNGATVDVKAFGACEPHPCDVGNTDAQLFAPAVGDNLAATARALIVRYKESFAEIVIVIEPRGPDELSAQSFTHFPDGSGRTNYIETDGFKK